MAWNALCFLAPPFNLSSLHPCHRASINGLSFQHRPSIFTDNAFAKHSSRHILTCLASLSTETAGIGSKPTPAEVEQGVSLLKSAAKTRKVPPSEICGALKILERAKLDPSGFLDIIGGTESPGRTWMLVFSSGKESVSESLKGGGGGGNYFPITAVQRFDAAAMRIENGVYFGPLGFFSLQGSISWQKRMLAFLFESVNIQVGPLGPFEFNIKRKEDEGRAPSLKDPFFSWCYADNEIIVARGKSGGIAYWCRCARVSQ